ncbi:MAG: hypothetical protein JXA82_12575 [Sedimentisphaerales bacterium]|nr:hypothetical protein [Sedimentisphaerales bacterium]
MEAVKKQLVLNKGGEKYIFRYECGDEAELLDCLVRQATDERTSFDWFDAAVLSFKLTQSLIGEADQLLYKDMPDPLQSYPEDSEPLL